MTPCWNNLKNEQKKTSQNIFSQRYQKIIPMFSSPFPWATLACSFLRQRFWDAIYLGSKNKRNDVYRSSSVSFKALVSCLFSSDMLSWCFTSFFGHTSFAWISFQSHSFWKIFFATKTATTRTLGLSYIYFKPGNAVTLVSNSAGCGAGGFARFFARGRSARDAGGTGAATCSSGNLSLNRARYRKPTPKKPIDKGKSLNIYHYFLSIV